MTTARVPPVPPVPGTGTARRTSRVTGVVLAALLTAILAGPPPAANAASAGPWRWPLENQPRVLAGFEPPASPWGPGHRGVDLATRQGEPVYATGSGRVAYAGVVAGRGVVTVRHGALRTTYLPVRASVRVGQRVGAGERIGVVEGQRIHCATRTCLHWGLLRGDDYLDPLSLLGGGPVRLLPLWSGMPYAHGASWASDAQALAVVGQSKRAGTRCVVCGRQADTRPGYRVSLWRPPAGGRVGAAGTSGNPRGITAPTRTSGGDPGLWRPGGSQHRSGHARGCACS